MEPVHIVFTHFQPVINGKQHEKMENTEDPLVKMCVQLSNIVRSTAASDPATY